MCKLRQTDNFLGTPVPPSGRQTRRTCGPILEGRVKMRPPKLNRLYEVMEINGVKVFVHWSVLLISAVVLLGAISEPATALAGPPAYLWAVFLHHSGYKGP